MRHSLTLLVSCLLLPSVSLGQQIPLARGSTVRLAEGNTSSWLTGSVLNATRSNLELRLSDRGPSRSIEFSPTMRLQVKRDSHKGAAIGAGIGMVIGTVLGLTAIAPSLPDRAPDGLVSAAAGALGAISGALVGRQLGPPRWVGVPLTNGRIAPAALTVHWDRHESLFSNHRWNRFAATEADFAAFFAAHADSLHPIEGLWTHLDNGGRSFAISHPVPRMVIARDSRFEGYAYIGVYVTSREPATLDGIVMLALTEPDDRGLMEMHHIGPSVTKQRLTLYRQEDDRLIQVEPDGPVPLWHKSTLVP